MCHAHGSSRITRETKQREKTQDSCSSICLLFRLGVVSFLVLLNGFPLVIWCVLCLNTLVNYYSFATGLAEEMAILLQENVQKHSFVSVEIQGQPGQCMKSSPFPLICLFAEWETASGDICDVKRYLPLVLKGVCCAFVIQQSLILFVSPV
ncbi:hypothetical protein AAFF_G00426890 [Aldrovandia affinis]|uniref:Uncharacterized protein n=1 Tax=Aldrovandia affinis TaxID=143900 RepID=A0AAD7S9G9_9TELE|nr:hypothetical protein AAFF_G00426890 [Aldrovandia affinis]